MAVSALLDFFYPRTCEVCGKACDRDSRHVCSACLMRLPFLQMRGCCSVCSLPVRGYEKEFVCDECLAHPGYFDYAVQAIGFEGRARELILDYKFNDQIHLAADFADWMEGAARSRMSVADIDIVTEVPLTGRTMFRRGYNQSEYLARQLSRRMNRKHLRVLARTGKPQTQSSLNAAKRAANVTGTFKVTKPQYVRGRTVLLVDDIMTTGSTVSECAKILKEAGAKKVWVLTLARALRN